MYTSTKQNQPVLLMPVDGLFYFICYTTVGRGQDEDADENVGDDLGQ
jgi:hypothetical protein